MHAARGPILSHPGLDLGSSRASVGPPARSPVRRAALSKSRQSGPPPPLPLAPSAERVRFRGRMGTQMWTLSEVTESEQGGGGAGARIPIDSLQQLLCLPARLPAGSLLRT